MGKFKQGNKKGNKAQNQHKKIQKQENKPKNKVLHEKMRTELNVKAQEKAQQEYLQFQKQQQKQQKKKQEQEELEQEDLNEDLIEDEDLSESQQSNQNNENQQEEEEQQQENNNNNQQKEENKSEEQVQFLQSDDIEDKRKVIIVLEGCMLETAKIKNFEVLLNSDEHKGYISNKLNRDFSLYRPDVVHHSLLSLLDSPLNKAGLLQVYIHTEQNVLIEVNPSTKIPRTYKRFAALMVQLLDKLRIRAVQSSETLLKVIKNPITDHLPQNCIKVGTSSQGRLVNMQEYIDKLPENTPVCYAVGGVSKGNPGGEAEYVEDIISVSKYSLSAGYCIGRMLGAYEQKWNIL